MMFEEREGPQKLTNKFQKLSSFMEIIFRQLNNWQLLDIFLSSCQIKGIKEESIFNKICWRFTKRYLLTNKALNNYTSYGSFLTLLTLFPVIMGHI
jgi:hypothetical protein